MFTWVNKRMRVVLIMCLCMYEFEQFVTLTAIIFTWPKNWFILSKIYTSFECQIVLFVCVVSYVVVVSHCVNELCNKGKELINVYDTIKPLHSAETELSERLMDAGPTKKRHQRMVVYEIV